MTDGVKPITMATMNKMHPVTAQLLTEIEAYRARAGISKTAFGRRAMADGNFVPRLQQGRAPSLRTIDRVRKFLAQADLAAKRPFEENDHGQIDQQRPAKPAVQRIRAARERPGTGG